MLIRISVCSGSPDAVDSLASRAGGRSACSPRLACERSQGDRTITPTPDRKDNTMGESMTSARAAGWYRDPPGRLRYAYWDGSGWRPDVTAAVNLMHGTAKFFIRRRALARIGEFVPNHETVECIAAGSYYTWTWGNTPVAVVLTDRRLLLLLGGRRKARVREYPRESISFAKPGLWGSITVIANGETFRVDRVNPHDADDMVDAIRDARPAGERDRPSRRPVARYLGKLRHRHVTEE